MHLYIFIYASVCVFRVFFIIITISSVYIQCTLDFHLFSNDYDATNNKTVKIIQLSLGKNKIMYS